MRHKWLLGWVAFIAIGACVVGAILYIHQDEGRHGRQNNQTTQSAGSSSASHHAVINFNHRHQVHTEKKTSQITRYLNQNHFVGDALIVKNNKVVYHHPFGYADYEKRRLNTNHSEFQILSIQKSLTAVGIMKLVQDGRLSLQTRLSRFYPSILYAKHITIKEMLDMVSGLSMMQTGSLLTLSEKGVLRYAVHHVVSRPSRIGTFQYQPVNYVLLAGIISRLTHHSYQRVFKTLFIRRMHLKGTGFVQNWQHQPNQTLGYRYLTPSQINQDYQRPFYERRSSMNNELGTGQVYMTTGDLFKVEREILRGKVISKANVGILHTPSQVASYGGGVYNGSTMIRLHGVGYGFESSALISKNGRTGVVLLTNNYRPKNLVQTLGVQLYRSLNKRTAG